MDTSRLASKNKRVQDWRRFLSEETSVSASVRAETETLLREFAGLLADCWAAKMVTVKDDERISDFERKLEQLNETGRLRTSCTTS